MSGQDCSAESILVFNLHYHVVIDLDKSRWIQANWKNDSVWTESAEWCFVPQNICPLAIWGGILHQANATVWSQTWQAGGWDSLVGRSSSVSMQTTCNHEGFSQKRLATWLSTHPLCKLDGWRLGWQSQHDAGCNQRSMSHEMIQGSQVACQGHWVIGKWAIHNQLLWWVMVNGWQCLRTLSSISCTSIVFQTLCHGFNAQLWFVVLPFFCQFLICLFADQGMTPPDKRMG